jgi:hypothetical protein
MRAISDPNPNLNSLFESDWQKAQDQYDAGVKAGYSTTDADNLYLQPVRSKWKIISESPQLLQDSDQLKKFHTQYDSAVENFHKNLNSYSRDGGQWASEQPGSLLPVLQKWSIQAALPVERKSEYADNSDQLGALKELQNGFDPMAVLQNHNSSRWSPEFMNKFQSEALRAGNITQRQDERSQAAAARTATATAKANSPEGIAKQRFILQSQMNQAKEAGADGMVDFYGKQLAALDSAATNSPSITGDSSYTFTPQDSTADPNVTASPTPANVTPKDKVALANQMAQAHPDWTKEQIILAIEGKLRGATQ